MDKGRKRGTKRNREVKRRDGRTLERGRGARESPETINR